MDQGQKFQDSSKKPEMHCKFCKIFGGVTSTHSTERDNKSIFFNNLLQGHKKKKHKLAQNKELCAMIKAFKKLNIKKKMPQQSHNDSDSEFSLSSNEDWHNFSLHLENASYNKLVTENLSSAHK
eukprot:5570153-Ditylum_brightwellii.AAC.1